MEELNNAYGGFVVSRNISDGIPIRYTYREKSTVPQLNGWTLLSEQDDDEYLSNARNFTVLNAKSIYSLAPQMIEIFEAPYGTNLFWVYEKGVHTGFYDLNSNCETTIDDILKK